MLQHALLISIIIMGKGGTRSNRKYKCFYNDGINKNFTLNAGAKCKVKI